MLRAIPASLLILAATAAFAKDSQTYYTPERIATARDNVARHDWAKKELHRIIETGDEIKYYIGPTYTSARAYAAQSDEFMWQLQPPTTIPRFFPRKDLLFDPEVGEKAKEFSPWLPYKIDPINHPYKVQSMATGKWYPSNDYANGDMTSGEYPDDGSGCRKGDRTFYFIQTYAHMVYGSVVVPTLSSLSQAYVLTGDKNYARKGTILLARLASEYPNHTDRKDRLSLANYNGKDPDFGVGYQGMITDRIWETFMLEATAYAYDAFYDYIAEDPELLEFLRGKGMPVETPAHLRRYIEENIFRSAMHALQVGDIRGNEGHHQAAALATALVMDDWGDTHPNSKDMVDYTYFGFGHAAYMFVNSITRDGGGHESPGYNRVKLDFVRTSQLMEQVRRRRPDLFPIDKYPEIVAGPKAKQFFEFFTDIVMLDYFLPDVGDSGGIRNPVRVAPKYYSLMGGSERDYSLYAFQRYGDPQFARICTDIDGTIRPGELFEPYSVEKVKEALEKPESIIVKEPRLLDGYGLAILETGAGDHRRAVSLNYTSFQGHRQHDNLSLELFARGVNLLPDIGYPASWDYRWTFDSNSMAHNTVTVDETQPSFGIGGVATLFASADGIHVAAAHHDPYPPGHALGVPDAKPCDLYERLAILVDIDPERFYVVDLFSVNGGTRHDQSWHALLTSVVPPQLDWTEQSTGTLAGENVAQFSAFTDAWGRERNDFPAFMKNIRCAKLSEPAAWTWNSGLPEGDAVRIHAIPLDGPLEAVLGGARTPARAADWNLDYLLLRRNVKEGERTRYLSVIDAYQGTPVVKGIRLLSRDPLAFEVSYEGGVDQIEINTPLGPSRGSGHRPLGIRVHSKASYITVKDVQIGNYAPGKGPGYAQGTIESLDYDGNRIAVPYVADIEKDFAPGRSVRIYNDKGATAFFKITAAHADGTRYWMTFDQSALVARGPASAAEEGSLKVSEYFLFATDNAFAGLWLGEGEKARQIKSASNSGWHAKEIASLINLEDPPPAATLRTDYVGNVISVWQYGIGDKVEAARIRN